MHKLNVSGKVQEVLQTAKIQNRPWRQEFSRFLLQYRTTSHSSTGVSPSELLFNISVGDYVLVRQPKQTPHFNQKPYLVVQKNKNVIKARSTDGHETERNISHFKEIPKSNDNESNDSDHVCIFIYT